MSDAEKLIPPLSASQVRRAIQNAKDAHSLQVKATGDRAKYVMLTPKTEQVIRHTGSKALQCMERIFR